MRSSSRGKKIGSLIVHLEEVQSTNGHEFDRIAIAGLQKVNTDELKVEGTMISKQELMLMIAGALLFFLLGVLAAASVQ